MGKERDGSDDRVVGWETVGNNSLGRASWGRSDTEATTRETVGNSLGRALLGVDKGGRRGNRGKSLGESSVGRERDGSDDKVDGADKGGRRGNRGK